MQTNGTSETVSPRRHTVRHALLSIVFGYSSSDRKNGKPRGDNAPVKRKPERYDFNADVYAVLLCSSILTVKDGNLLAIRHTVAQCESIKNH